MLKLNGLCLHLKDTTFYHSFSASEMRQHFRKLKSKCPRNEQQSKMSVLQSWQGIRQENSQHLLMPLGLQPSDTFPLQMVCKEVLNRTSPELNLITSIMVLVILGVVLQAIVELWWK